MDVFLISLNPNPNANANPLPSSELHFSRSKDPNASANTLNRCRHCSPNPHGFHRSNKLNVDDPSPPPPHPSILTQYSGSPTSPIPLKGSKVSAPIKPETQKAPPPIEVPTLSLDELKEKYDNFGSKALIGEGAYGKVYYATLNDGKAVAVKKLDVSSESE